MGKIIGELNQKRIKLNITAVYSAQQVNMILKRLKLKQKLLYLFVGRLSDSGKDPINMLKSQLVWLKILIMLRFCGQYKRTL